jgi:hypothetical protein
MCLNCEKDEAPTVKCVMGHSLYSPSVKCYDCEKAACWDCTVAIEGTTDRRCDRCNAKLLKPITNRANYQSLEKIPELSPLHRFERAVENLA